MAASSEQMLISSIVLDKDFEVALKLGLGGDMFHTHKVEYEWIETYYKKYGKTPSKNAFRLKWPECGVKEAHDTEHFVSEVRNDHVRHQLLETISEVAEKLKDKNIDGAMDHAHSEIVRIAGSNGLLDDGDIFTDQEDIMADLASRHTRYAEFGAAGIPTGFATFDERVGGFEAGFHLVAARAGVGKSMAMQKMATAAVMNGSTVQFDALEQTRAQVSARIFGLLSGRSGQSLFSSQNLLQGKDYDQEEFARYVKYLRSTMTGRLHVSDSSRGRVTTATIAAQIERNKPDIVFIDYITLMGMRSTDWQGIGEVSGELTQLAGRYGIPIVSAAQLNRQATGKEAGGVETIAQSDGPGRDATTVTTIASPSPSVLQFKVPKNRNGEGGFGWWCQYQPGKGIFEEISYDRAQDLIDEDKMDGKAAAS